MHKPATCTYLFYNLQMYDRRNTGHLRNFGDGNQDE